MALPNFLKKEGNSVLFNGDGEFVFYIPELYFDRKFAIINGEYVNLLGVLDYSVFDSKGKSITGLRPFKFPTIFLAKPSTVEKVKKIKLKDTSDEQDYRFLRFKKGDQIVVHTKVPESIVNVEEFYKLFLSGKLPTTIPYDKMWEYFIESANLNDLNYDMSIQIFGILYSEICRDKKDIYKPFRLSKETNMLNYQPVGIVEVPKLVSPHSSITSENWDEAVVNAVINKNSAYSPMEKLLMEGTGAE